MDVNATKQLLHKLAINNHKLEKLNALKNQFNPFEVLGVSNYEIRHSNMLGWLMTPSETHNLGDLILKKFLLQVLIGNEDRIDLVDSPNDDQELRVIDFQLKDFSKAVVYREYKNIDLLIISKENELVVIVENKIKAKESKKQLKKYKDFVNENFPDYTKIKVFLTLNGDEPENDQSYLPFSHLDVATIIEDTLSLHKDRMNERVKDFINFYIKTLKNQLGMDDELRELCLAIYEENKSAIDLINKAVKSDSTSLQGGAKLFKNHYEEEIKVWKENASTFWFAPKSLINVTPSLNMYWPSSHPICLFFSRLGDNELKLLLEVGPIEDSSLRLKLLETIEGIEVSGEKPFKVYSRAKRPESKYTRIHREVGEMKDASKESVFQTMNDMYEKALVKVDLIVEALNGFDWK